MTRVDNRGLNCPEPVIRTKKALESIAQGTIISIVDNEVAKQNVLRMATSLGYATDVASSDGAFRITIIKGVSNDTQSQPTERKQHGNTVMLIQGEHFGQGDAKLGEVLMKSFFHALSECSELPKVIYFLNSGVKLTCQGSGVVSRLEELVQQGVEVYSCGTCLDFYMLKDQLAIGEITNMYSIVESMLAADKTITL